MGPLFTILFGAIVAGLFLAGCAALWIHGRKSRNWSLLKTAIAIAVTFFLHVGLTYGAGFVPSYAYYHHFGFSPTNDVTGLRGYTFSIFDGGQAYLRFHASPETVGRIIDSRFVEVDEVEFRREAQSPPPWWRPFDGKPSRFYKAEGFNNDGSRVAKQV
jgi:hypothetical protein